MTCSLNKLKATHTATCSDGDLDGIPARLTDILQVERFVGRLVFAPLDVERVCVDGDGDGGWPVGIHLPVLVVETLQLQLQVGPVRKDGDGGGY